MIFSNPYPHIQHEVYPMTFLQMISAKMKFTSQDSPDDFWNKFRKFSEETFHIPVKDMPFDKDHYAELSSEEAETSYAFKCDTATVVIGSKGYNSFKETMPVHFKNIGDFLQNVACVSFIDGLTLEKRNRFPFHVSLEKLDLGDALNYVFKTEFTEGLEYRIEVGQRVKVTKDTRVEIGKCAYMILTVGFQVIDDSNVHLIFDVLASYTPSEAIGSGEIYNIALELNDIMFGAFRNVVTDNIIDVMKGDN